MRIFNQLPFFYMDAANEGGGGGEGAEGGGGGSAITQQQQQQQQNHQLSEYQQQLVDQGVPQDVAVHTSLKDIKDIKGLVSSYTNAQTMLGRNRIALPDANATQEEKDKFYNSLGRPEKAEGYEAISVENLPESFANKEKIVEWAQKTFHAAGVPKEAAEAIFKSYGEFFGNELSLTEEQLKQNTQTKLGELEREFGGAYENRMKAANSLFEMIEDNAEFKNLLETVTHDGVALGNHPTFIKAFVSLARKTMGENFIGADGTQSMSGRMTPDEAKQKIKELEADPEWRKKLMNKSEVGHKEAQQQRSELFAIAYPAQQ